MFSEGFKSMVKDKSILNTGDLSKETFSDLATVSSSFKFDFEDSGYCINYQIKTIATTPIFEGKVKTLGDCLDANNVPEYCYDTDFEKFKYLKGSKHILRTAKTGHEYYYSEGPIAFPDHLDKPGRTMLTSEGTTNRSSHYILDPVSNKYRILTPIECERLDEFPDDWTNTGMSAKRRYFIAGNALVCGLISTMGNIISKIIDEEQ